MLGDSHAALYGHGARRPGDVKVTYGTGSSIMGLLPHGTAVGGGLARTVAWQTGERPVLAFEGNILSTGATLVWLAGVLQTDPGALIDLAATVDPLHGVNLVPAFAGLAAPWWSETAEAALTGFTLGTSRAVIARAAVDSIALQVEDVLAAAETAGPIGDLLLDGGPSANDWLAQHQADLSGRTVRRSSVAELVGARRRRARGRGGRGTARTHGPRGHPLHAATGLGRRGGPARELACRGHRDPPHHEPGRRRPLKKGNTVSDTQRFGAGIWHFATYVDRYATDGYGEPRTIIDAIELAGKVEDLSVVDLNWPFFGGDFTDEQVKEALESARPRRHRHHARDVHARLRQGRVHEPGPRGPRARARVHHAGVRRGPPVRRRLREALAGPGRLGLPVPGRPRHTLWKHSMDGVARLASENPDLKFVIEYKPREPRVHMSYSSVARTLIGIEQIGLPNVGILLDFGHALFGGESPADSAQLAIDHGRLFGMDVNDNLRSWDDDMVAGTVHPIELFEFFWTLKKNDWEGVWQLDQFPFREDSVTAAEVAIDFLRRVQRGLDRLDVEGLMAAQERHDAMAALSIAQAALYGTD